MVNVIELEPLAVPRGEAPAVGIVVLDDALGGSHLHRRAATGGRPITQLAVGVVPPGPGRPIALDGQAVVVPGRDGRHTRQVAGAARPFDLHRRRALGGGAVAQLAVAVVPPGPGRAVTLDRQAMILATGQRRNPRQVAGAARPFDLHRRGALGGGAVAQLKSSAPSATAPAARPAPSQTGRTAARYPAPPSRFRPSAGSGCPGGRCGRSTVGRFGVER